MDDSGLCFMEMNDKVRKESNKRGRKPGKKLTSECIDTKTKLERSRQSARECRARKKLRYQYLEELVNEREKAIFVLRKELEKYKSWSHEMDSGNIVPGLRDFLVEHGVLKEELMMQ